MRTSTDHILTSHAGSLPRPDALIAANRARDAGDIADEAAFQKTLGTAVGDVVRHQHELGIDVPGDGEFGKSMAQRVNYGSWWRYSWQRLSGIEPGEQTLYEMAPQRSRPRRDRADELRRPARPRAVRRRLQRPGIRDHHRPAAAGPGLHRARSPMPART